MGWDEKGIHVLPVWTTEVWKTQFLPKQTQACSRMQYWQTRWVDVGIGIFDSPGGKPNNDSRQQVHSGIHQTGDDGDGARQGHCHCLGHKQQLKVESNGSFNRMTNKATAIALVTNNSSLQQKKIYSGYGINKSNQFHNKIIKQIPQNYKIKMRWLSNTNIF